MNKKVTIIDYSASNILSLSRAFEYCGANVRVTGSPKDIEKADYLVLPGVGAFPYGMQELEKLNIISSIRKIVADEKPFLGVCLGMQMMLESSTEIQLSQGLGLIAGTVLLLPLINSDGGQSKIPHISWDCVNKGNEWDHCRLLHNIDPGFYAYFVHSFYVNPVSPSSVVAVTPFNGFNFPSIIQEGNVFGMQFHPEKSGDAGIKILRNFLLL